MGALVFEYTDVDHLALKFAELNIPCFSQRLLAAFFINIIEALTWEDRTRHLLNLLI